MDLMKLLDKKQGIFNCRIIPLEEEINEDYIFPYHFNRYGQGIYSDLNFVINFPIADLRAIELVVEYFKGGHALHIKKDAYDDRGNLLKGYMGLWIDKTAYKDNVYELIGYCREIIKHEFIVDMSL